jgi:SNF2 family DNA or RNA helicase
VVATGFEINYSDMAPQPILTLTRDLRNQTCFRLTFLYEKNEIDNNYPFSKIVTLIHHQTSYGFRVYHRNRQKEQKIIEKLQNLHLHETAGYYYLKESNPLNIINWLNNWAAALKEFGFSIHQKDLTTNYYIGSFQLRVRAERKNADWFDVYALVEIDDNTIPFLSFRNYIRQGRRDFMLPDGKVFVIPEAWFERFTDVMAFATKSKKGDDNHFLLRPYHIPLLSKATQQKLTGDGLDRLQRFFESPIQTNVPVPVSLKAILRNYQQEGLSWLKHLHDNNFGGCLADDMGLGKTLQTLALILLTKQNIPSQTVENGQMNLFDSRPVSIIPSLIIVPTSLIHNWALEIQKFAPTLRWLTYTGKRDHLPRKFNSHDIIITSYGIARNDIAVLKKYSFHYVVLDESQFVKNHESKTYRALLKLQSAHKLVLTGTPIENSLKDLWSQLNFLNRGLLGTHQDFVERYVIPIERYQDEEKKEKLQHLIRPFLLRRKKSEVAKELPPVTEQVLWCEMTEEQADRYERYKSGIRNNLIDQLEDQNLHQEQMQVLEALLRLRQMANHPVLADETYSGDSGKFDEVVRIVSNIVAENHKILIFSSFVQHLKLFAHNFEQQQLPYSMLTGATTDRQSAVNNFQQDENKRVFLISLKAGGTGLNLTRADYVILLDPWWNPAAEQQALSRAHRIGQDKKVFVFKMITRNTIEEKIYALQQRKTKLAETFVNSNNPFKNMSAAEIQALFD